MEPHTTGIVIVNYSLLRYSMALQTSKKQLIEIVKILDEIGKIWKMNIKVTGREVKDDV